MNHGTFQIFEPCMFYDLPEAYESSSSLQFGILKFQGITSVTLTFFRVTLIFVSFLLSHLSNCF